MLWATGCLVDNPAWLGPPTAEGSGSAGSSDDGTTGDDPTPIGCTPLSPSDGDVIDVTPADAAMLDAIVADAPAGATIRFADGVYDRAGLPALRVGSPGVTLRSASGDAQSVVLDGGLGTDRIVQISADDVTLTDLTLRRSTSSLVVVRPAGVSIARPRVHRVVFQDSVDPQIFVEWEGMPATAVADDGVVSCSRFEVSDEFRQITQNDCLLGGIRAGAARGWHVYDNRFVGHWCPTVGGVVRVANATLLFTDGSRDTVVERNVLLDNHRGIGFGVDGTTEIRPYADNPCTGGVFWGHIGGAIRNNTVWIARTEAGPGSDAMIFAWHACGVDIFHNTIVALVPIFDSIEYRYPDTTVRIANNLATHAIMAREGAAAQLVDTNVQTAELGTFVDPLAGDVHLLPTAEVAIDRGAPLGADALVEDFEGQPRDSLPDLGADELVP